MLGQMMEMPLLISSLLVHADHNHGDTPIVSRTIEGPSADDGERIRGGIHRYRYRDAHRRARQLARVLADRGIRAGDRVATLAWNGYRHFELYYAISGSGAVTHTINPRLHADQVAWIVNHADDQILFFDISFAAVVEQVAPQCPGVKAWVAMTDRRHMPAIQLDGLLCYEELIADVADDFQWPMFDERQAACLCYTSGTTGNPKGVLYSHRSTLLHAMASLQPDVFSLSADQVVLPVVPMFHVNAWGLAYAAPMVGAKLVFPGAALDGASLCELFEQEQVTMSAGVPTVWLGLLQHLRATGARPSSLRRLLAGGSAVPPSLTRAFASEYGLRLQQLWGMTELSPLGVCNAPKRQHASLSAEEQFAYEVKQGRAIWGVEMKIVDEQGQELPRDGQAAGDLLVRGPWVVDRYYQLDQNPLRDGWFPTGDVGTLDPDGYLQITDRSKDVIKSGGEWIGSIELENLAMAHPDIAIAAVIGVPHAKWGERPILIAVRRPGATVTAEAMLAFYDGKIARWWTPDVVEFVDALPLGATGKVQKNKLREQFVDRLASA